MTATRKTEPDEPPSGRRRYVRPVLVVLAVLALAWLATWLLQRSYQTPGKKRALQSWLDEKLNADVSLLGGLTVRTNLARKSRLFLHDVEIEHPNPLFPGKFARIRRVGCWAPPWAVAHLYPGTMDALFNRVRLTVEENDAGEWSTDGFMQPLAAGNTRFPFPMPLVSDWKGVVEDSSLTVSRRGYELTLMVDGTVSGRVGSGQLAFHDDRCEFTFGKAGDDADVAEGVAESLNLRLRLGENPGQLPRPIAGRCAARVRGLPLATLPFFIEGIPLDAAGGTFAGLIRYDELAGARGMFHLDGELADAPLAVFGLPRTAPIRVSWPIDPEDDGKEARIHLGPSGFGAFEITAPLDAGGNARQLVMRGDVADLDAVPALFTQYQRWPEWLSRAFPGIQWRSGSWRGFGWRGENLQLSLTRTTAGLNLSGDADMMGGRIRLAMTPGQTDAPITVSADRLDPMRLSARLSQMVPEPFRARINGPGVNLTWRGFPSATGELEEWGTGMVWSKPIVDVSASGDFWKSCGGVARAIAGALPEWGGGGDGELMALSREGGIPLEQLSIVSEADGAGGIGVEFRAYGEGFGLATGLVERRRDGTVEGEFLLSGPSALLRAVERANADFSHVLDLLANESPGLRVRFSMEPEGGLELSYPFLDDARRLARALRSSGEEAP